MILYFSSTGNSAYVANKMSVALQDNSLNLLTKLQQHDNSKIHSEKPWVIVAPTYAWQIPHILYEWIENTTFSGHQDMYFIMTCGANIGNAGSYLKKLCKKKELTYGGCMPIVMPDNYIVMFGTPTMEQSLTIIEQAQDSITEAVNIIQNKYHIELKPSVKDKVSSSLINKAFYPFFVHTKKFYATDACTSCGICTTLCPMNNIQLNPKKPIWGNACTHCMACINQCPVQAIQYGKKTLGISRYICPKE